MEVNAENRDQAAAALAAEILGLARATLQVELRFLDRALGRLTPTATEKLWFGTDGRRLYYEPWYVLGQYKAESAVVARDMLHTLLHCVLRHYFVGPEIERARWDLACDMAVEHAVTALQAPALRARRESRQQGALSLLQQELPALTAERIYRWLGDKAIPPEELARLRQDFLGDQHGAWYGAGADAQPDRDVDVEELWQQVARRMERELELTGQDPNGALTQNLRQLKRRQQSYTDFLRRFGVWGEELRPSDEEFDAIFYTYGLSLYGDLPLVEPLEYRERRRIRQFVVAIDTSGSVRGEVVQSFVQHTYDILARQEDFFTRVELHILQCDDRIREDALITDAADFRRYLEGMEIRGLGRTDFRPVFDHVAALRQRGRLRELRGLIYFTDGRGTFPARKPPWETAFILHGDGGGGPPVPGWAMHMELTDDDILDKRFSGV